MIYDNGETKFQFSKNEQGVFIDTMPEKGVGLRVSKFYSKGTIVLTTAATLSTVRYSDHKRLESPRICQYCFFGIKKKGFKFSSLTSQLFCSKECMASIDDYMLICGNVHESILSLCSDGQSVRFIDIHLLALKYLFLLSSSLEASTEIAIRRIQCLTDHSNISDPNLNYQSNWLHAQIIKSSPQLYASLQPNIRNEAFFNKLFRIIQFNAQPLTIQGLDNNKTQIICVIPSLALLNHSCSPNAKLNFQLSETKSLQVSIQAIRNISSGEEICISYLSSPLCKYELRQEILQKAFHFTCQCELCTAHPNLTGSNVPNIFKQQEIKLETILQQYANKQLDTQITIPFESDLKTFFADILSTCWNVLKSCHQITNNGHEILITIHDMSLLILQLSTEKVTQEQLNKREILLLRAVASVIVCDCLVFTGCFTNSDAFLQHALLGAQSLRLLKENEVKSCMNTWESILCGGEFQDFHLCCRNHLNGMVMELETMVVPFSSVSVIKDSDSNRLDVSSGQYYCKILATGKKLLSEAHS